MRIRAHLLYAALALAAAACGDAPACGGECATDSDCPLNAGCDDSGACACHAGYVRCGGRCILQGSGEACGGCVECSAPADGFPSCQAGKCGFVCRPGFDACGGRCVRDDAAACGPECAICPAPAGGEPSCREGRCEAVCPAGFHVCSGACVSSDVPEWCGGACDPCPVPSNGTALCRAGTCEVRCDAGYLPCGSRCVLPGEGVWTLRPVETAFTGLQARSVAAGDFDEDGTIDLAVLGVDRVAILRNLGDGLMAAPTYFPAFPPGETVRNPESPPQLAASDLDGDGHLDLLTWTVERRLMVLAGAGDGTFGAPRTSAVSSEPGSVAVADFDGDGVLDVALAKAWSVFGGVEVVLGTGDGSFVPAGLWRDGEAGPVTAGDLDGDGRSEIVDGYSVLRVGTTGLEVVWTLPPAWGNWPWAMDLADMDGDSQLDLIRSWPYGQASLLSVLQGTGSGFLAPATAGTSSAFYEIEAADMDGDGWREIVALVIEGNGAIAVMRGPAGGPDPEQITFHLDPELWWRSGAGLAVADLDGDRRPDVATGSDGMVVHILLGGCL